MSRQSHITRTRLRKVQALLKSGRVDEARNLCEKVCNGKDADARAWNLLGRINLQTGRPAVAIDCYRHAADLAPDDADSHAGLALAQSRQRDIAGAVESYRAAIALNPADPRLLTNYGAMLMGLQRYTEAEPVLRAAVTAAPGLAKPWINLGGCLNAQGRTGEALASIEDGMAKAGPDPVLHSNFLLTRHYLPLTDIADSLSAHRHWAECNAPRASRVPPVDAGGPDKEKRLRIGYVSPDFRTHSVAYFLKPLLANHDRQQFDVYCYSDVAAPDEVTLQFRSLDLNWRDASSLDDAGLERTIRGDRIDILVDLAGHTAGNRLMVFARRPAPVQLTWLGYPDTTGLDTVDYRITDDCADPVDSDSGCTEELYRLPDCFLCYEPFPGSPDVARAPCEENGFITFGSFNNLAKINGTVITVWSALLERVPGSRLLIKNPGLTDSGSRERYLAAFREAGIYGERVVLKGVSRTTREHLAEYGNVDIALDTFPYNGTTTTCEAIWMGVPVLTLSGTSHAGRVGASLLNALGLNDWVTQSTADYVERASGMAADTGLLAQLRGGLRDKMKRSVLCDGPAFAARFEAACREVWGRWCDQPEQGGG